MGKILFLASCALFILYLIVLALRTGLDLMSMLAESVARNTNSAQNNGIRGTIASVAKLLLGASIVLSAILINCLVLAYGKFNRKMGYMQEYW
jgi:hypothetical protein